MNTVWRVMDYHKETVFYLEKKPHVRRYLLNNTHHQDIEIQEVTWHYKNELIKLLNESIKLGYMYGEANMRLFDEEETQ